MKRILFLRHAITDAHVSARENPTMGFCNMNLNEKGKNDCKIMANKLSHFEVDCIISSDVISAMETTQIICERIDAPVYYSTLLRERDQGVYTGRKLSELNSEYHGFSITTKGQDREELGSFIRRTRNAIKMINQDYEWNTCLIVSHKGFLRTMMAACFGINPKNWYLCEMREMIYDELTECWVMGERRRLDIE